MIIPIPHYYNFLIIFQNFPSGGGLWHWSDSLVLWNLSYRSSRKRSEEGRECGEVRTTDEAKRLKEVKIEKYSFFYLFCKNTTWDKCEHQMTWVDPIRRIWYMHLDIQTKQCNICRNPRNPGLAELISHSPQDLHFYGRKYYSPYTSISLVKQSPRMPCVSHVHLAKQSLNPNLIASSYGD